MRYAKGSPERGVLLCPPHSVGEWDDLLAAIDERDAELARLRENEVVSATAVASLQREVWRLRERVAELEGARTDLREEIARTQRRCDNADARCQQALDALAAANERCERLRGALAWCAIPLEALRATEMDGRALAPEMKRGIMDATERIRDALTPEADDDPR